MLVAMPRIYFVAMALSDAPSMGALILAPDDADSPTVQAPQG